MLEREDIATHGGAIRVLTLTGEARRNALTPGLVARLRAEVEAADAEREVGALVLTHAGRAFCAGSDLRVLQSIAGDEGALRGFLTDIVDLFARIETARTCTIAAVEGAAVGGGFELALACDLRVFGAGARVALPETGFGALPGGGGVQRLARFVGRGRAMDLVLQGETLTAEEGAALGLGRTAPAGEARAVALELARKVTSGSRYAVAEAKRLILASEPVQDVDPASVEAMVAALLGPEGREGLAALADKRAPDFAAARAGRSADA